MKSKLAKRAQHSSLPHDKNVVVGDTGSKAKPWSMLIGVAVFIAVFGGLGGYKLLFSSHAAAPVAPACTLHATTSTFASTFSGAAGGSVICLAPGSYGDWTGGTKSSMVTITPDTAAGGTAPTPPTPTATGVNGTGTDGNVKFSGMDFTSAAFIKMNGITFTDDVAIPWGTTTSNIHDVTIQNSIFHAHLEINDTVMNNSNVIIDYNMFPGDKADCLNGPEGRIQFANSGHSASPDGVIIENNNIGGVPSVQCDGIQIGGYGVQVLNNWFHDFHYQNSAHTDGIQDYGGSHEVIKGNLFYNVPDTYVAYDGMDNADIENNVSVNDGQNNNGASPNQVQLLANSGSTTVKHNTVVGGLSWANSPEGNITLGSKGAACNGITITDNVATAVSNGSGGGNCTYTASSNLLQQGGGNGSGNIAAAPSYVGGDCGNLGADPPGACGDVWANFMLKSNSPGHLAANDGTDMGAFGPGPSTPGGPFISGGGGGDTTPPTVSVSAPSSGATVSGTTSVTATAGDNVAVASVQFKLDGTNLGSADTTSPYNFSWDTTSASNGSHTLTAVATDTSSNSTTSSSVTVTVSNSTTDTTPPVTSISSGPASSTTSTSASFSFSGTDNVTPAGSLTFQCQLDGAAYASCSSPKAYSGLAVGSHTFNVKATDQAGNTDPSPASQTWTITSTTAVTGDLDGDGHVTGHDLSIFLAHYGTNYAPAEFDGGTIVEGHDLSILLSNYGK